MSGHKCSDEKLRSCVTVTSTFRTVKSAGENILESTSGNDFDWLQPEFYAILDHHCLAWSGNLPCQNENHSSCISNVFIYNDLLSCYEIITKIYNQE